MAPNASGGGLNAMGWTRLLRHLHHVLRPLLLTLTASAIALSPPFSANALADGKGVEIFRAREGAYEIIVGVQPEVPVVGTVHITVTPVDLETSLPVVHAEIVIVAHDPEGVPAYQARAVNLPLAVQYYDANITFESPGDWTLIVDVRHDTLGSAEVSVPLHVGERPFPPGLAGTIVWVAVVLVLAGGAAYLVYRVRHLEDRT